VTEPRVLGTGGKLALAALSSALGGIGGLVCGLAAAMLLAPSGDAGAAIAGVGGLVGAGGLALALSKYHLRTSWPDSALQMRLSFGVVGLIAVGAEAALAGVLRWRHLVLPESAPLLTAMFLLGLPALGGLGGGACAMAVSQRHPTSG
jgi:hypothetical protein